MEVKIDGKPLFFEKANFWNKPAWLAMQTSLLEAASNITKPEIPGGFRESL